MKRRSKLYKALDIIWYIGLAMALIGLLYFWTDRSYRHVFFYIILPLILLRLSEFVLDWIRRDRDS